MTLRSAFFLLVVGALAAPASAHAQAAKPNDKLSIFFSGDVQGEIISCGCPDLDRGGVTRRASFFKRLREANWEFVTVDAGGLLPFEPMDEMGRLKFEVLIKSMASMGYDGVTLGDLDLASGPDSVAMIVEWLGQPIVATNYDLPDGQSVRSRTVKVRDWTIGIVGFLDPEKLTARHDWIEVEPWDQQRELMEDLAANTDYIVAVASVGDSARSQTLAIANPEIDFLVTGNRGSEPFDMVTVGYTRILGVAPLGQYLGRAEVTLGPDGFTEMVETTHLPVVESWGRTDPVDELLTGYYREVRRLVMEGKIAAGDQ